MTIHQDLEKLITDIDQIIFANSDFIKSQAIPSQEANILAKVRKYLVNLYKKIMTTPQEQLSEQQKNVIKPNFTAELINSMDRKLTKSIEILHTDLKALPEQGISKFLLILLSKFAQVVEEEIKATLNQLEIYQNQIISTTPTAQIYSEHESEQILSLLELASTVHIFNQDINNLLSSQEQEKTENAPQKIAEKANNKTEIEATNTNIEKQKSLENFLEKFDNLKASNQDQITQEITENIPELKKEVENDLLETKKNKSSLKEKEIKLKSTASLKKKQKSIDVSAATFKKIARSPIASASVNQDYSNIEEKEPYLAGDLEDQVNEIAQEIDIASETYAQFDYSDLKLKEIAEAVILEELLLQRLKSPSNLEKIRINQSKIEQKINKITSLTDLLEPETIIGIKQEKNTWYLGIDLGTIGISAVLLNSQNGREYPIYWCEKKLNITEEKISNKSQIVPSFILPTTQILTATNYSLEERKATTAIGIENLKVYLNFAIIYYQDQVIESDREATTINYQDIQQALEELFSIFCKSNKRKNEKLELGAVGLSAIKLEAALAELQGVIISCPALWSDTYRFNIREAIIRAKLVKESAKIFFLPEAIALLLSRIPISYFDLGETLEEKRKNGKQFPLRQQPILTLIISPGATTTELALVDLPPNWQNLTHNNFSLWSFAYGDNALEQDIFSQIIYPQWLLKLNPSLPNIEIEFPLPGDSDLLRRDYLNWRLQNSSIGINLKKVAKLVKEVFPKKSELTLKLGRQELHFKRQDLEEKIIIPMIENLNQELDKLLTQRGKSAKMIEQIILNGTTTITLSPTLISWLQGKFPQATLIQENNIHQVAAGLARLPLFPLILDLPRHQYSDYFLLVELLQTIPNEPFTIEELMQLLRMRGINTRVCENRIIGFLNGDLPPGLLPFEDFDSQQPLFYSQPNGRYYSNPPQRDRLTQYLDTLISQTEQKLTEPLVANLLP